MAHIYLVALTIISVLEFLVYHIFSGNDKSHPKVTREDKAPRRKS